MKLHLARGLKFEVLGNELVVLDATSGVVHRLSGAARELVEKVRAAESVTTSSEDEVAVALVEAGVLIADGGPLSRRAMLGFAAGLGIVTLALPTAAAAASPAGGVTGSGGTGSGGAPVTTTSTSTTTTTVVPQVPATISGMTGSDISSGSGAGAIRLTFTTPNNNGSPITEYRVYKSSSPTVFETVTASEGPLNLTGLNRGESYTFTVAAVNAVGEAAKSNAVTVTPAALAPGQVTGLSATAGAGKITLSFTAPASNGAAITSYKVYRTVSSVDSLFMTYSGATGPIEIDMLDPTESYTFKVAAVNSAGDATISASDTTTPSAVATGGTVTYFTGNGTIGVDEVKYAVHKFVNDDGGTGSAAAISSSFVLNAARNLDYLVVAAGGSGGSAGSVSGDGTAEATGGGGAGGVRQGSSVAYTIGTYAVSVGGRTAAPSNPSGSDSEAGTKGANSSFGTVTATGGGGGGKFNTAGGSGGSGGGAGGRNSTSGGSGTSGQGNAGGSARPNNDAGRSAGGGGGGAGGAGTNGTGNASQSVGGTGGVGVASTITGTSVTYAAGGGAGAWHRTGTSPLLETAGAGGSDGVGGAGSTRADGKPGLNGRGGGGGGVGSGKTDSDSIGGAGGSGIVVIRYPITKASY